MKTILALLAFSLLTASTSFAFDCSGVKIKPGLSTEDVLNACGEPAFADHWREWVYDIYGYPRPRIMDKWTYNRGKSYFMLVLTFEDGFLIRVERGSKYGF